MLSDQQQLMNEEKIQNKQTMEIIQNPQNDNIFSLRRLHSPSSSPCIQVDFSLPPQSDPSFPICLKIIPKFHKDNKHYTPSFILPIETMKYQENDLGYKLIHERKVQEMHEEKVEIFVPKPSKANSYCCICKAGFDDYLTHVNIPKHIEIMNKSPYCQQIRNLCRTFNLASNYTTQNPQLDDRSRCQIQKKKKITKQSSEQPKRGRGRPRKILQKMQMLASIPTSVSISI